MENQLLDENIAQPASVSFNERVNNILANGYRFDLGGFISAGSRILNKNLGSFIGMLLLYFVVVIICNFIPVVGGLINMLFLSPAFLAGNLIVAHLISKNKNYEFNHFFSGFKYVLQMDLLKIMQFIIFAAIAIPYLLIAIGSEFMDFFRMIKDSQSGQVDPGFVFQLMSSLFIKIIPLIFIILLVSTLFALSNQIIIFGKKGFWEALTLSSRIVWKKFFGFLMLYIVLVLINIAGAICLLVGLLYTVPLTYCTMYAAYEDIIGTNADDIQA